MLAVLPGFREARGRRLSDEQVGSGGSERLYQSVSQPVREWHGYPTATAGKGAGREHRFIEWPTAVWRFHDAGGPRRLSDEQVGGWVDSMTYLCYTDGPDREEWCAASRSVGA